MENQSKNQPKIKIGLTGNPNIGKSTLFNALTGARQHVGNWPGKTVEKKEGEFKFQNTKIEIVDLPGSYSLTAYTEEETVTANFILKENPDIIVQIVDAQNLERNLFMTLQLMELQAPLVIALNMLDLANQSGIEINSQALSKLLGVPVVVIDAKHKKGIDELLKTLITQSVKKQNPQVKVQYGTEVNEEIEKLKGIIRKNDKSITEKDLNWMPIKLLEEDVRADQELTQKPYYLELKQQTQKSIAHLENVFSKNTSNILANTRYGFIKGLSKEVVSVKNRKLRNFSDKIDCVLTNKYLGIPIFVLMAWLMFQMTFVLSEPVMGWIESFLGIVGGYISEILTGWNVSSWLISLIVDGIIGGVGGVLVFVPIIGIMFLIIALLEDSGYMARVAYVMDKLMHRIGLHGKAFIPLILGFGCNVPGIMATRTLENGKDRLMTILMNPFISCGARLPVYALFAGAFFAQYKGWVIFSLYFLGILVAIFVGLVFKKLSSKTLSSPFVIELPTYRWPTATGVLIHVWERIWIFIKKAGTIILAFSVIIWALASFPVGVEYGSRDSMVGHMGQTISPVFEPLGFGNWQSSVALMFGFVAKEVVVGTFGTLYGIEDTGSGEEVASLSTALQEDFTPLSAYSFMVFVLLYIPCMAVLAVVKRETNSWKWPLIMILYSTTIAWTLAFIVYQGGKLLGFN